MKLSKIIGSICLSLLLSIVFVGVAKAADAKYTDVKNTQIRDALTGNDSKLAELETFSTTVSGKGLALKIAILADGQKRTNSDLADLANKAFDRNGFEKFFIGPDYKALSDFKDQSQFYTGRIEQLRQLGTEVKSTESDTISQQFDTFVKYFDDNNSKLLNTTTKEEKSFSLFGWLIKLF